MVSCTAGGGRPTGVDAVQPWNPDADPARSCMPAGQSVGSFHNIRPAGEVLREIATQAADILRRGVVPPGPT
jgi:hypothetical protein